MIGATPIAVEVIDGKKKNQSTVRTGGFATGAPATAVRGGIAAAAIESYLP